MYPTAEVRWFYRGPLPAAARAWFESREGQLAYQAPRRDRYLGQPSASLSCKFREGRLEIKLRPNQGELFRLHPQVTGILERWHKWSFALADPGGYIPGNLATDSFWLSIDKHRAVARYRVAGNERPVPVPPDVYPVQGCQVEMVELYAAGQPWWGLCFEAFGQGRDLPLALLSTARLFFAGAEPPQLGAADSYGYAHWLSRLAAPT